MPFQYLSFCYILSVSVNKSFERIFDMSAFDTTDNNHLCAKVYNVNIISMLFNISQQAFKEILL